MNLLLPNEFGTSSLSAPRYLLLDGAQYQADPAELERYGARVMALLDGEMPGAARNVAPHLLQCSDEDSLARLHLRIMRASSTPHALSYLQSTLDLAELASRLKRRLLTRLANGRQMLLRIQDARVLGPLAQILTKEKFSAFFNFFERSWYLDTALTWARIDAAVSSDDPEDYCLELDTAQRRVLQDTCYPHAVIAHFLDTEPALLDAVPEQERYAYILHALQAAKQLRIEDSADVIVFCTLALVEGVGFHQQSDWKQWLAPVAEGRRTFAEVLDDYYFKNIEKS